MALLPRVLLATLILPGSFAVLLPQWIARSYPGQPAGIERAAGWVLVALGAAGYVWCAWSFATRGRGTPAPWDPPQSLVVSGPYRYSRNPMYVALTLALAGQACLSGARAVWAYAAFMAVAFHLRAALYEEPRLRQLFGAEYDEYCRQVGRWI